MVQGAALPERHPDERALRGFGCLADGFGNLPGLAMAKADPALLVADDDERGETESAAAFHHLGDAIDMDQTIREFAVAILAIAASATFPVTRHELVPFSNPPRVWSAARPTSYLPLALKSEAAFAGAFRQRLDPSVIHIGTAVEHDFANSGPHRTLGKLLTDDLRRRHRCPALQDFPVGFFERRRGGKGAAQAIVDDLAINLLRRAKNGQPRLAIGMGPERAPDTRLAAGRHRIVFCHAPKSLLSSLLLLLAFLTEDKFIGIFYALALIGFGRAQGADFRGCLPHLPLVDASDRDFRRLGRGNCDSRWNREIHVVAIPKRKANALA